MSRHVPEHRDCSRPGRSPDIPSASAQRGGGCLRAGAPRRLWSASWTLFDALEVRDAAW